MKTEELGKSKILNLLLKPAGFLMESGVRRWLIGSQKMLQGANLQPGQTVLEVGAGTGFFTIPAAKLLGEQGHLIAIEVLAGYVKHIEKKLNKAGLKNVRVIQRDALETGLEKESVDSILLFGVIPFPTLPLNRLLREMHRVLRPDGTMAVWLFPTPAWVPRSIQSSGLFEFTTKENGVYRYKRINVDTPAE